MRFKSLIRLVALVLALLLLSAGVSAAATVEQGKTLLRLGLNAGAEDTFRELQDSAPTAETTKGLLQALLAQNKPAQARAVLDASQQTAELLNTDETALYAAVVALEQTGTAPVSELSEMGLDANEKNWAHAIKGLAAFCTGDYAKAEAIWRGVPDSGGYWWTKVLIKNGGSNTPENAKEIESRLEKLRRQDWPVVRNFLIALIAGDKGVQAREILEKNASRWSKGKSRAESGILRALTFSEKTPERAEALMEAVPLIDDPSLLMIAIGFCVNEPTINLTDVEQQLGKKKEDAATALILAQAWVQKGSFAHAYELLGAADAEDLPDEWKSAYYSTLASVTLKISPPRYREAAAALQKWQALSATQSNESAAIQQQIADAYFKNGDAADAAAAYEKNIQKLGFQAVVAWLSAGKPDEAKRILLTPIARSASVSSPVTGFENWSEALLAYLMDVEKRGGSVEEAYQQFAAHHPQSLTKGETSISPVLTMQERWPIEYLRVLEAEKKDPQAALEKIIALKDIPTDAPFKVYFDLKKYRLLMTLRRSAEAGAMLDNIMQGKTVPREFLLIAVSRALLSQKPEDAMELLPKIGTLPASDRVGLMLLVARSLGNDPKELEKVQTAIDLLPSGERIEKLVLLARCWADIGRLDRSRSIVDSLQESSVEGKARNEVDFLKATIDELSGDLIAENEWVMLSQREDPNVKVRALARLAAYDAQHNKPKDAQTIFYAQLVTLLSKPFPEGLRESRDEIIKSLMIIAQALPAEDAERVRDWVDAQRMQPVVE